MAKKKKNISLEEDILKIGLERAKMLGYNFSTYVTFLINNDTNNSQVNVDIEKVTSKNNEIKLDDEILCEADSILNDF